MRILFPTLVGFLVCISTAIAAPYSPPDLSEPIFGGDITLDDAARSELATSLAGLIRNKLVTSPPVNYELASHIMGVALRLDPANETAVKLNDQLANGAEPDPIRRKSGKGLFEDHVRAVARSLKDSASEPDRTLAAYLYLSLGQAIERKTDDLHQFQLLQKSGVRVSEDWKPTAPPSDSPAPTTEPSTRPAKAAVPTSRPVSKIRAVTVGIAPDGRWHGNALDLIAISTGKLSTPLRVVSPMGKEMQISFDEAKRLVQLRHPSAKTNGTEISFGDKYSSKDGGSAGTAFTLLILSSLGDFPIDESAAITGDITVDSKIRPVGAVAAKVHGAAMDRCHVVAIPSDNAGDMDDAIVLQGAAAAWETQVFTIETLDDAIAVMRADRAADLTLAMQTFDDLKSQFSTKRPQASLATGKGQEMLAKIIELAPNHLSARMLQRMAAGKAPTTLSPLASITESLLAIGPMRFGLSSQEVRPAYATDAATTAARRSLEKIKRIAHPSATPVIRAIEAYSSAYANWAATASADPKQRKAALAELSAKREAVLLEINRVISDPALIDKMIHP